MWSTGGIPSKLSESFALIVERIWKGDILTADIEELENLEASEVYPERLNAKEVLLTHRNRNLYFLWQMVQQNCQEETTDCGNPL